MQKTEPRHPFAERFGQRFRELRKEKGYTLEQTALAAGFHSKAVLSQFERGDMLPTFYTLQRLGTALGVDPLDLVNFPERGLRNELAETTRNLSVEKIEALLAYARTLRATHGLKSTDAEAEEE